MKLRFIASGILSEYHSLDIDGTAIGLKDGDTADVSDAKAKQMVLDFPQNIIMLTVTRAPEAPPSNKMMSAPSKKK